MSTKYDNTDWSKCAQNYDVMSVVIDVTGNAQGNDGVSLPCKGCYVQTREDNFSAKMSIGRPATAVLGVELAPSNRSTQPLWVPVSDVAQLYFYSELLWGTIDIMPMFG